MPCVLCFVALVIRSASQLFVFETLGSIKASGGLDYMNLTQVNLTKRREMVNRLRQKWLDMGPAQKARFEKRQLKLAA